MVKETNCYVTFGDTEQELVSIESELAKRHGLMGDVRQRLIQLDKENKLVEDELVMDWHDALASYYDWIKNDK